MGPRSRSGSPPNQTSRSGRCLSGMTSCVFSSFPRTRECIGAVPRKNAARTWVPDRAADHCPTRPAVRAAACRGWRRGRACTLVVIPATNRHSREGGGEASEPDLEAEEFLDGESSSRHYRSLSSPPGLTRGSIVPVLTLGAGGESTWIVGSGPGNDDETTAWKSPLAIPAPPLSPTDLFRGAIPLAVQPVDG